MRSSFKGIGSTVSPLVVMGAIAVSLVSAFAFYKYSTAAEQAGGVLNSQTTTAQSSTENASAASESSLSGARAESHVEVDGTIHSTAANTQSAPTPSAQSSVTVDGTTYSVENEGELHQTHTSSDGETRIDISVQSSGSGDSRSTTRMQVSGDSQSQTSVSTRSSQ